MIWNFGGWPQNYPTRGCLNKYTPLLQDCFSAFPRNLIKDLFDRADEMSVVLIFDICNDYKIVTHDSPYSQYWVRVKMVDMALKFLGNIEDTLQLDSNLEPLIS